MKFAEIIRNAGLIPKNYPNCANMDCHLYDGKGRLSFEESIQYAEPFFKHNEASLRSFCGFISDIKGVSSIDVMVNSAAVVLFYKTAAEKTFTRNKSMDPIDYMD